MLLSLLAGLLPATPAWAAGIEQVAAEAGRVVIRFDDRVDGARASMVAGARAISIDVAGAIPGRSMRGGGLVRSVRQVASGDGARITIDLSGPAVIADGGFDADGRELTLSLSATDDQGYAAASMAGPLDFFPFNLKFDRRPRYKVSVPVPAASRAPSLPRVQGNDNRPLVVIDAGHGGVDPGAINPLTGLREKDVTLKIARAIRDELLASGRVRVALTRDDDRYLVLRERYGIARRLQGGPVHLDPLRQRRQRGRDRRVGLYAVGGRVRQGGRAAGGAREQGGRDLGRQPGRGGGGRVVDPDRPDAARDDERVRRASRACWGARPSR